jgi:N-acyl-D-aspartate/D-glutamate deacylase
MTTVEAIGRLKCMRAQQQAMVVRFERIRDMGPTDWDNTEINDAITTLRDNAEALGMAVAAIADARSEAVAAIYFDDSADYRRALFNVLRYLDAEACQMITDNPAKAFRKYYEQRLNAVPDADSGAAKGA